MIQLIDLLEDILDDSVNKAVQEINALSIDGVKKLQVKKKTIVNKDILSKIQFNPPPSIDVIELSAIIIDPEKQKQNVGSTALKTICEIADKYNAPLYLEVVPIGNKPLTTYQLVVFYEKFGFRMIKGGKRPFMFRKSK